MSEHAKLSQARLKELLHYDPLSGVFTWKVWRGGAARAGTVAGRFDSKGYRQITVEMVAILAHRLAWFYMTGVWPEHEVDHINGIRADNSWANLRKATKNQNQQNLAGCRASNKSTGLLGASYDSESGKYLARIMVDGKGKNLGRFATAEEAHRAYCSAKKIKHTHNERLIGEKNVSSSC